MDFSFADSHFCHGVDPLIGLIFLGWERVTSAIGSSFDRGANKLMNQRDYKSLNVSVTDSCCLATPTQVGRGIH